MKLSKGHVLGLALQLTDVVAQNRDAEPYVIAMVNNASVGPDGPWWFISQAIDYPDQYLPMMPSITQSSLTVNESACRNQHASCPLPLPEMWTISGAYQVNDGLATQSDLIDAASWDPEYAALLDMSGSGRHFKNRMTLHRNDDFYDPFFLDGQVMGISFDYTVNYSADSEYALNVGFMSLNGAREILEWEGSNGTGASGNTTLSQAYRQGAAPSLSYGLHIGSVEPNVTGSLVLGGYDSSRCLTDPIISKAETLQLVGIALNVSSGGFAYENSSSAYIPHLLRANGSAVDSIPVRPRPGVPHLYLPQDTCDAIASHLPVTYNLDFNLYLWDTEKQAYKDIISSPHHLSFTFASENKTDSTISVPFALLNLTLSSPIISTATQYFPCKPWTPGSAGYTLGNAFLQSAFLAQNWQENTLFLAQAPGPGFLSANIQKIGVADTILTPARNPPSWEDSWSNTLKALPARSRVPSSGGSKTGSDDNAGISGGTIAGIVVGVIGGIAVFGAIAWLLVRRRKKLGALQETVSESPNTSLPHYHDNGSGLPHLGKPPMAPSEAEAQQTHVSEMWAGREVAELPAKVREKQQVYA